MGQCALDRPLPLPAAGRMFGWNGPAGAAPARLRLRGPSPETPTRCSKADSPALFKDHRRHQEVWA